MACTPVTDLATRQPEPAHTPAGRRAPVGARLQGVRSSDILQIAAACREVGGIDLATGIPAIEIAPTAVDAASAALRTDSAYSDARGVPALRRAVADMLAGEHGIDCDPDTEVQITSGVTGGFAACMSALFSPGDEVLVPEPFFGWHVNLLRLAGVTPRFVRMPAPSFALTADAVRAALGPRTRGLILCTPSNPSGAVCSRDELEKIADIVREHDLIVVTDEQYAEFCYDADHAAPASVADLGERTVTLGGFSKSLAVTGWRMGYAAGPARLIGPVQRVHTLLYICPATPLQHGVVAALADAATRQGVREARRAEFASRRDQLCDALEAAGFSLARPAGGFFVLAEAPAHGPLAGDDPSAALLSEFGIAAVPGRDFFDGPRGRRLLRFCFAKDADELAEACRRLRALGASATRTTTPPRSNKMEIRTLESRDELTDAARLAYEVYVKECGILGAVADHDARELRADDAEHTRIIGAYVDGELVGSIAAHLWADHPFSEFYIRTFELERFDDVAPRDQMAIVTRLMVKPERRARTVTFRLLEAMWKMLASRGITLTLGDCQPHLLGLYRMLGMRPFGRPFNYNGSSVGIPLVGSPCDHDYLRKIRAPMMYLLPPESEDRAMAVRLRDAIADGPVVTRSDDEDGFWDAIASVVFEHPRSALGVMAGASHDAHKAFGRGFILDCARGDLLIGSGQNTRMLYIVLEGELEVGAGERRRLLAGAVCGADTTTGSSRRTADVHVASDKARVLCLNGKHAKALLERVVIPDRNDRREAGAARSA